MPKLRMKPSALQQQVDDPENWLEADMPGKGMKMGMSMVDDVDQLLAQLTRNLKRVPPAGQRGHRSAYDIDWDMVDRMFNEANPVFKRLQSLGMFNKAGMRR